MPRETILLAEDDPSLRQVIRLYLEHSGYAVLDAGDGMDALFLSAQHQGPIDLLFADIDMYPMGGPELAERLLLQRPATQVLFMSGMRTEESMREGLLVLGAQFLGKPFNPKMLAGKVREILDTCRSG